MAERPVIDTRTVNAMLSLLDWAYRKGISDAIAADDEGLCREYLEKTEPIGAFGFLGDDYLVSWDEWCLRIIMQVRMTNWNGIMAQYLNRAGRYGSSYLSVFYVLIKLWLRMGVKDYLSNPKGCNKAVFDEKTRSFWTKSGLRGYSRIVAIDTVQVQCFNLERECMNILDNHTPKEAKQMGAFQPKQIDLFRKVFILASKRV